MLATDVHSREDLLRLLEERSDLTHIHAAVVDPTGQLRGKTYSVEKVKKGLDDGIPITPNLASADFTDVLYPVEGLLGGDPSFPDAKTLPAPVTLREIPWESPRRNLILLLEYVDETAVYACPRSLLRKQIDRAAAMGFSLCAAFELEFRLFRDSLEEAVEAGFRRLTPCPARKYFMGVQGHQADNEFFNGLLDALYDMGMDIETYHAEMEPGFHELVMRYQTGIRAADDCAYIKTMTKSFAQRHGKLASFMARPVDGEDGSSLHAHLSLQGADGTPAFYDETCEFNMSPVMRHFMAGLQQKLPELQLMYAPSVNGYRRYAPGLFAPVATTWGLDNRTVGLRVVGNGGPGSIRVENRLAGSDANPYYILAATLAAGLWGIENRADLSERCTGYSWETMDQVDPALFLQTDLGAAIDRFRQSKLAEQAFSAEFQRVLADNRSMHLEDYRAYLENSQETGEYITDWELQRFLERA